MRHLLIAVALIAVVCAVIVSRLPRDESEAMGRGSPEHARKWKALFDGLADPDVARSRFPDVAGKRFDDGSWVFGVAEGSHGDASGGTVVVKDNHGRVRAFFGHVCSPEFLEELLAVSDSLPAFYGPPTWKRFRFNEHAYP